MSTTMMPFLYQTRTLSSNGWLRTTNLQFTGRGNISHRTIALSMRVQHSIRCRTISTTNPSSRDDKEMAPKGLTTAPDSNPTSAGSWADDSDLRAFTQDKSDFQQRPLIRKHYYNLDAHRSRDSELDLPSSIDFEDETLNQHDLSGKDEIYQLTDRRSNRESTITPSERLAFQKIFSDIFQRQEKSVLRESSALGEDEPAWNIAETDKVLGTTSRPEAAHNVKSHLAELVTGAINMSQEHKEEAVNRYPLALRPAAARAIGLEKEASKYYEDFCFDETQALIETEKLETLREPERVRVESLMKAATTDFELWNIMEREVFSLIPKMGLAELPTIAEDTPLPKPKQRRRKSRDEPNPTDVKKGTRRPQNASPSAISEETSGVTSLSLHGPLYPSYILLGLRLLDRSFARPSPLARSLLPKIKSLGFISHVLGASTQFYNELIRIYRYRHDDFVGIIDLLSEMENAALEMDEDTFDIVYDIVKTQVNVRRGNKGEAIEALWKLSEFRPGKFNDWMTKIHNNVSTAERSKGSGYNDQFSSRRKKLLM